jgi:hypothetical protein
MNIFPLDLMQVRPCATAAPLLMLAGNVSPDRGGNTLAIKSEDHPLTHTHTFQWTLSSFRRQYLG